MSFMNFKRNTQDFHCLTQFWGKVNSLTSHIQNSNFIEK
jgi:hypothetical protein